MKRPGKPDPVPAPQPWLKPWPLLVGLLVLTLGTQAPLRPAIAATTYASQALRWTHQDAPDGYDWDALVGFTGVSTSSTRWRARGTVSWWNWQPGSAWQDTRTAGLGALYLTAGHRVWQWGHASTFGRLWLQLKGTLPLSGDPSIATSGETDWGGSILATNRFRDVLVFVEAGFLNPGDPPGLHYQSQGSLGLSASWHPAALPFYPLASLVTASAPTDGSERYTEWSAGVGASLGARTSWSVLYNQGANAGSPDRGLSMTFSLRL